MGDKVVANGKGGIASTPPCTSSPSTAAKFASEINNMITFDEWEERKRFAGFGKEDENILRELHLVARTYADEVMDQLYERWLQFPELRQFFIDENTLKRVKLLQKQYFIKLTSGEYGMNYLKDRLHIGLAHRHIGLAPRWYMGGYSIYMQIVFPRVLSAFEYNREKRNQAINALTKIISLDQEIALLAYFGHDPTYTKPIPIASPSPSPPSSFSTPAASTPPLSPMNGILPTTTIQLPQ